MTDNSLSILQILQDIKLDIKGLKDSTEKTHSSMWKIINPCVSTVAIHDKEIYGNGKDGLCTRVSSLEKNNIELRTSLIRNNSNNKRIIWLTGGLSALATTVILLLIKILIK